MSERRPENVVAPREIKQPLILTLDVGTSSVRALAFDAYGRQLSGVEGRATYDPVTTPDGGFELGIENLVRGTTECLDQAAQQLETHRLTVAAVAMDTFWHNLIALGPGGVPLTQVITWADTRSTTAVEELRREIDERELHSRTGCVLHSSYWPAKLRWLRRTNTDLFNAARHWVSVGEYLVWRFCGAWSCSVSMASGTGLLDQNRCDWDPELLKVLGLSSALLSPLQSGRSSVGTLTNTWAERWPLLRRVPWFPAAGDGACSNIGSGCTARDRVALMIGTSGALRVCFEARQVSIQWGLWCYHAVPSYFLLGGALSNGGLLWEWLLRTFRVDTDSDLEEVVASVPPDGHGLTVLPFLAGERSPNWNGRARAAFVGVSLTTEPRHFLRAGLEAVSYRFALLYDLLKPLLPEGAPIIANGGAIVHSPLWVQMLADVLGTPVTISQEGEATSRGAAILGLWGLGALDRLDDPRVAAALGPTTLPDKASHDRYQEGRERQQRLYKILIEDDPFGTRSSKDYPQS